MRSFPAFLLIVFALCRSAPAQETFHHYGSWSNVAVSDTPDPHASGYQLDLWRHGDGFVGTLSQYVGPVADPPLGELQHLVFNPASGKLEFDVEMTVGLTYSVEQDSWVPAVSRYTFQGRAGPDGIRGVLKQHLPDRGSQTFSLEQLVLSDRRAPDPHWEGKSFDDWRSFIDGLLDARGLAPES